MAIILTDIAIAVWLKNIENDHFYITKLTETSKIKLYYDDVTFAGICTT